MRKKKNKKKKRYSVIVGIIALLSIVGFLIRREDSSTLASPVPTFVLNPGEVVVQVSTKLVTSHEDLRIGGGSAMVRDYINSDNETMAGLTMVLDFSDERIKAYKGLEWDYRTYHLRVLDIFEGGSTMLAISSNN